MPLCRCYYGWVLAETARLLKRGSSHVGDSSSSKTVHGRMYARPTECEPCADTMIAYRRTASACGWVGVGGR